MKYVEQLRRDRETMARLTPEQKRIFIWDYYKLSILVLLSAAFLLGIGVWSQVRGANTAFYAVLLNANNAATEDPFTSLLEQGGVCMEGRKVDVESRYTLLENSDAASDAQTLQVLAALFGVGDLDVFVAPERAFDVYAEKDAFVDLSLFVPASVLEAHRGDLYYRTNENGETKLCGIWLRKESFLHESGYYTGDVLLGVAANAQNLDNAIVAVQQMLETDAL